MPEAVKVTLQPAEANLQAGGEVAELVASVQNAGEVLDQYDIAIEGLEHAWYTVHTPSVGLFPGDHSDVRISLHPPKRSDIRAGDYPFLVKAVSQVNKEKVGTARGTLKIQAFAVFKVEIAPQRVNGRRGGSYRVTATNSGTVDLTVDLKAADREGVCQIAVEPESMLVAPGEKSTANVRLKPDRGWLVGPVKGYDFTVTAAPQGARGDVKTINASFVHRPLLASWRPVRGLLRTLVIIAVLLSGSVFALSLGGGVDGMRLKACYLLGNVIQPPPSWLCAPIAGVGLPSTGVLPPVVSRPPAQTPGASPVAAKLEYTGGFLDIYKANPTLIGEPLENVVYDRYDNAHQNTTKGLLVWYKAWNTVYFFGQDGVHVLWSGQVIEVDRRR